MQAFNVKLPEPTLKKLRAYSKVSGLKIWKLVNDALIRYLPKAEVK